METQLCRSRTSILVLGVCLALMVAVLTFGQEQPPQQNQPAQNGRFMPPAAGGPRPQGVPGPVARGSNGPGSRSGAPDLGPGNLLADLLQPDVQKELAITAEQRQKLDEIRFNSEKESIQHRAALQIQNLELSHMLDAENPDRAGIDKKIQEIAQEQASLLRTSINAGLNARSLLTAEQRIRLARFMQNRPGAGQMPPGQPGPRTGQPRDRTPMPVPPAPPQAK